MVEVDGKRVAGEARVPAGLHRIATGADGFETLITEAYVSRGETRTLAYRLDRSTGALRLASDEDATVVEIGSEVHGLPFFDDRIPVGDYVLRFRSRGFLTRERKVRVERNKETRAWVSMVPTGFRAGLRGNTFEGPIATGDMDGDGVPDVSTLCMQELYRLDGKSGGISRATIVSDRIGESGWGAIQWDADGCPDDALISKTSRGLVLVVLSGRETGPVAPGVQAPPQKKIWSTVLDPSLLEEKHRIEPPVEFAGNLWVPVLDGIRVFEHGTGKEGPAIHTGGAEKPRLRRIAGGSGLLALTTGKLRRYAADGTEVWSKERPDLLAIADRRNAPFEPAADGLVFAYGSRHVFALRVADASVAWEESDPDHDFSAFLADSAPATPRTVFLSGSGSVQARDASTGRSTLPPFPVDPAVWNQSAVTDTALFYIRDGELVCLDTRSGAKLWANALPAPSTAFPSACDGPDGPEYWYTTGDGRLLVLAGGRLPREVPLSFTPRQVTLRPLDADGRPEAILVGYGLQVVNSTRMLWKRRGTNNMRPRPVVFDAGKGKAVVEIGRWENGVKEARAFAAETGELLWGVGGEYDVMLEPALFDIDGDGTLDVLTQQQVKELTDPTVSFVALSGRDGHLLKSIVIPFTPYPPAIRIDTGAAIPEFLICPWAEGLIGFHFGGDKPTWKSHLDRPIFSTPLIFPGATTEKRMIVAALAASHPEEGAVAAWSMDGKALWTTPLADITWGSPFPFDTDGDGTPEILVPGRANISVLSADGKLLTTWNGLGGTSVSPTLLPDGFVTGLRTGVARARRDGTTVWTYPCAFVTGTLAIAALPGSSTPTVIGIDWNGRLFCLDLDSGAERWRVETGARCEHGVTVADVGGIPVAFIGSDDFTLYAFDLR
ncbi:MAG: PQQ-binding-like beta-propeller repeat protein [Planctomycetes bacterium]|nr:PQQ-binding-like beta-propeller repeat protein [Planctomycetota bacterium]